MSKEARVKGKRTLHACSVLTGRNLRLVLLIVGAQPCAARMEAIRRNALRPKKREKTSTCEFGGLSSLPCP